MNKITIEFATSSIDEQLSVLAAFLQIDGKTYHLETYGQSEEGEVTSDDLSREQASQFIEEWRKNASILGVAMEVDADVNETFKL